MNHMPHGYTYPLIKVLKSFFFFFHFQVVLVYKLFVDVENINVSHVYLNTSHFLLHLLLLKNYSLEVKLKKRTSDAGELQGVKAPE